MGTFEQALAHYETGRTTATGLMLEALQFVSLESVDSVINSLPTEVFKSLERFVLEYRSGRRIFNGPKASAESVRIVKGWLAERTPLKSKG